MEEKKTILKKVKMSLDTMRPYLQKDGGDIEIVGLSDENVLSLKFIGNCSSCLQTPMTSASIEEAIKNYIAEIKEVIYVD
ncbi:MAG: Fe-S cluster biogenesis protein NfuA [Planctomycetota bacterium]|jgi:Fe-S cluster biogenesis protein NfuA